jgi:hypothetical protein
MKTPHGYDEIIAMFGDPENFDGTLNSVWEAKNIKSVAPPPGWQLYYQQKDGIVKVRTIRLHRLLEGSFQSVLRDIWNYVRSEIGSSATEAEIRQWLHERRLDIHGGGYNFREKRGNGTLSLHSYGIAIDWDPLHNPRKKPLTKTLPEWWYELWQQHGWTDGREFPTPDPMHVQFATGA